MMYLILLDMQFVGINSEIRASKGNVIFVHVFFRKLFYVFSYLSDMGVLYDISIEVCISLLFNIYTFPFTGC